MKKFVGAILGVFALLGLFLWLNVQPRPDVSNPRASVAKATARNENAPKDEKPANRLPSNHASEGANPQSANADYRKFLETTPVPEPVRHGETAWLVPTANWKNVGRASIGAAVQSEFWAMANGDTGYLRRSIVLDGRTKQAMEALLAQVPEKVREEYSTAEALAAFFLAGSPAIKGYALGSLRTEGAMADEVRVSVDALEPEADKFGSDRFAVSSQLFRRDSSGEWLRVIDSGQVSRWSQMIKWDKELSKSRIWSATK